MNHSTKVIITDSTPKETIYGRILGDAELVFFGLRASKLKASEYIRSTKEELKVQKANWRELKKNKVKYQESLRDILVPLLKTEPHKIRWGALKIDIKTISQRVKLSI